MIIENNKNKINLKVKSLIVAGTYEKLLYGLNFENNSVKVSYKIFKENDNSLNSINYLSKKSVKDSLNNSNFSTQNNYHENLNINLEEEKKDENDVDMKSIYEGKELIPSFIYPTHLSSISCLSMGHSKYLATGSSDENIKLYGKVIFGLKCEKMVSYKVIAMI